MFVKDAGVIMASSNVYTQKCEACGERFGNMVRSRFCPKHSDATIMHEATEEALNSSLFERLVEVKAKPAFEERKKLMEKSLLREFLDSFEPKVAIWNGYDFCPHCHIKAYGNAKLEHTKDCLITRARKFLEEKEKTL